ncbi:MAG TPA: hypothetical protein VN030_15355 [Cellvibrio sp.]|nr:hypothetical protein [Cellvibrio sp.]
MDTLIDRLNAPQRKLRLHKIPLWESEKKLAVLEVFAPPKGIRGDAKKIILDEKAFQQCHRKNRHPLDLPSLSVCDTAIEYEDSSQEKVKISVELNIISAQGLASQFTHEGLTKLLKRRLFLGFTAMNGVRNSSQVSRCHIYSGVNNAGQQSCRFFVRSDIGPAAGAEVAQGFYTPINEKFVLEMVCRLGNIRSARLMTRRFAELTGMVDAIFPKSRVRYLDADLAGRRDLCSREWAAAEPIVEDVVFESLSMRSRRQLEFDLLRDNKILQSDCLHSFSVREMADNALHLGDGAMHRNFLSDELVIPSLDFDDFQGTLRVPLAKTPDTLVEQEIQREIMERYQKLKVMLE